MIAQFTMPWEIVVPIVIAFVSTAATWVGARLVLSRDTTSKTMEIIVTRLNKVEEDNERLRMRIAELECEIIQAKRRESKLVHELEKMGLKHD